MHRLLLIVLILVGIVVLFWLMFGINWRSVRNYERLHNSLQARMMEEETEGLRHLLFSDSRSTEIAERFRPLSHLLAKHGRPSVSKSDYEIITSGKRKYELLCRDIEEAKESIHMEYFHFGMDKSSRHIRRLLMQKAREGVDVRFINENIANFPIPNIYYHAMRRAGVRVVNFSNTGLSLLKFLMTLSYRDHRKIVVIDGRIGYAGGMNITENYFRRWRDTHVRITGEAVASLQYAFLDTWLAAGGRLESPLTTCFAPLLPPAAETSGKTLTQVTPDDPTSPEALLLSAYEWILDHAQQYVWIQTPYLAPPKTLIEAMRAAAARGVEVRVMVPEVCDTKIMRPINRAFYHGLVQAGVQLYLRTGEFIHSKTIVADDYLCCIGSTNLDYRSFGIDFELNVFFYGQEIAEEQKALFCADLPRCRMVSCDEPGPTAWQRLMQNLAPIV